MKSICRIERVRKCSNKIDIARCYNLEYNRIITTEVRRYFTKEVNENNIKLIARYRCETKENIRQYWKRDNERLCRLCKKFDETVEHLIYKCEKTERYKRRLEEFSDESGL